MTLLAFILIFASLFLHIAWNLLSKRSILSLTYYMLMALWASVVTVPFLFLSNLDFSAMPKSFWLLLLGSIIGELFYMSSLALGYRIADVSLFYPLLRAFSVAMLAFASLIFPLGKENLSTIAFIGMQVLTVSCVVMNWGGRDKVSPSASLKKSLLVWGLVIFGTVGITLYTAMDNAALACAKDIISADAPADASPWSSCDALAYLCLMNFGLTLIQLPFVLAIPSERKALAALWKSWSPMVSGVSTAACYGLCLIAMPMVTNVAIVYSFRQLGLPLGFLAGVLLLHEKVTWQKLIGIIGIVIGTIMTAL